MDEHRTVRRVTVYWRPGCPYCVALQDHLDRAGLPYETRNIWEDADAAAFVRTASGGNETVPTVTVGDETWVNPPAEMVLEAAGR